MSDEQNTGPEEEARRDETAVADSGVESETIGEDPLKKVAGAMITAAEGVQRGASDAKSKAQQVAAHFPHISSPISRNFVAA